MAETTHISQPHRDDEALEIRHRGFPFEDVALWMLAVAMPTLVVAVDVADRGQRFGNRAIDTAKEAGRVKNHDRLPVTAPVEVMKLAAVDTDVTAPRFLLRYTL